MASKNLIISRSSSANQRYAIDENTRLSISTFGDPSISITYAVALFRRCNGKWLLDHKTALEFSGKRVNDVAFRATDYGASLAKSVLGDKMPERFFRDNLISK